MSAAHQTRIGAVDTTVIRRALLTAAIGAGSSGRIVGLTMAALLVAVSGGPLLEEAPTGIAAVAAVERDIPPETVPVPWIVAFTAIGAPAYEYARRTGAGGTAPLVQTAVLTVEDAWSAAFFGDKQRLAAFIEHAALVNGLPVEFLLRLLRQESGLNYQAVSRSGAQGVAQFMPGTAGERGLTDPFNPYEAIPKSAELLTEYRTRFGSLGLAAAAYNAGPQRVRNWLSGQSGLPKETRDYVARITGRSVEDWRQGGDLYASADPRLDPQRP